MLNPHSKTQLNSWYNDLLSFFTKKEINQLADVLLEVYINSYQADNQEHRQAMFLFLQKLNEIP